MPIFRLDVQSSAVQCYAPPANLISDELYANGGMVEVLLTTNGQDFSANSSPFLYRPTPTILSVDPLWLRAAYSRTVTIKGSAFFEPAPGALARLTALSDPTRTRDLELIYVNSAQLEI
jgi:hypothetical protein